MLYFIQSGSRIKIGRAQNPFTRFRTIHTASPDECRLLLAMHVHDERGAEELMHAALKQYRTNGEWFEINFKTAFWTMVGLELIPKDDTPHLELPIVPPVDPDFLQWYTAVKGRVPWTDEEIHSLRDDIDDVWYRNHQEFQSEKARYGNLATMIEARRPTSNEEASALFAEMRRMLHEHKPE